MENKIALPKKFEPKHYLVIIVLVVASFLRLYNIPSTVQFLGDQGRDAMIVADIFRNFDPVFIGPVTSVGNMYLGPLYYYFMLPFLMLTYPSPMGPVYAVAGLGILTVFLMYYIGKRFLDEKTALWATVLFGFSAVVAHNTRFSWNPNPAPIVSLFLLFFTYQALKKDVRYWIFVTICFAVLIQLHYLTLLSGAGFGLLWIYQLVSKIRAKKSVKKLLASTAIGVVIFLLSLMPLILFDLRHGGVNKNAFLEILTKEDAFTQLDDGSSKVSRLFRETRYRSELIITDISIGKHTENVNFYISGVVIVLFVMRISQAKKQKKDITGEMVLASFLLTGILGTALYKQNIYEHYIAYLFPVTFFVLGYVLQFLSTKKVFGYIGIIGFLVLFARFNYGHAKVILSSLGWTIAHIQSVAQTIEDRVLDGEKYNIVLLNSTGDTGAQNYRYFLSASKKPPVLEEQYGEVETLFIIDEERKFENETELNYVYPIVTFPDKEIREVYYIPNGPEIIVLRRNSN